MVKGWKDLFRETSRKTWEYKRWIHVNVYQIAMGTHQKWFHTPGMMAWDNPMRHPFASRGTKMSPPTHMWIIGASRPTWSNKGHHFLHEKIIPFQTWNLSWLKALAMFFEDQVKVKEQVATRMVDHRKWSWSVPVQQCGKVGVWFWLFFVRAMSYFQCHSKIPGKMICRMHRKKLKYL